MTAATTRSWTKLSLWLGDGASPEDFTSAICGITTKDFTISAQVAENEVPDCDDPDLPAWVERVVRSLSAGFTGSGIMAEEVYETYRTWALAGTSKNARVVLELGTPGYFEGAFVLTNLGHPTSRDDGKIGISIEIQSDGVVAWQAGAP